jgi:hypothetical protein
MKDQDNNKRHFSPSVSARKLLKNDIYMQSAEGKPPSQSHDCEFGSQHVPKVCCDEQAWK